MAGRPRLPPLLSAAASQSPSASPAPGSAPVGSGACAVQARGRSLCPRRQPARERNGGGGEVGAGDRRGADPEPPGAPRPPAGRLGPAAPVRPVDAQALPEAPLAPCAPGPASRGSLWALRGAGISGSLGFRDR